MENNQLQILESDRATLARLCQINMPGASLEEAERMALKEITNLEMILTMNPDLAVCNKVSMLQTIKQSINDNLTLAPSAGLVYLYPSHVKVGFDKAKNCDIKEWVMVYDPTANGRLSRARQAGRVLDCKKPSPKFDATGKVESITVEFLVPSYPSPRWEVITFYQWNFDRWRDASAAKRGKEKGASAQYTKHNGGIDPEFAAAKALRHGLAKLGVNMNERPNTVPANKIDLAPIISADSASKEAGEDNGYTHFEEIPSTTTQPDNNQEIPDLI